MDFIKTFFTFFALVMRSERGSVGVEQEPAGEVSGIEKYMDDANLETLGAGSGTEEPASDGQPSEEPVDASEAEKEGDGKPTLEEQLEEFGKDADGKSGEGDNGLLDQLNALGILRNGLPVEFDDVEKAKEMLSKGFDYTQKTQELAEQRKEQEEALTQREQEINQKLEEVESYRSQLDEQILENQVMAQIISELQANDPDVFEEIKNAYQQKMGMYNMQQNHPALKQYGEKISQLEKQLQQTGQQKEQEENQTISKEWESGLSDVQSKYATKLKKLGVKPNWEKVKQAWQSDASNSTSVKEAFFAVHGDQITAAMEAANKLASTRAKSSLRMGPQGQGKPASSQAPSQHGHGTYLKDAEAIAAKYGI